MYKLKNIKQYANLILGFHKKIKIKIQSFPQFTYFCSKFNLFE